MKSTNLNFPQTLLVGQVTVLPADTTTPKDVMAAVAEDTIIKGLVCTSDDSAAVNLQVFLHNGTTAFLLGTVNVPIAAGTNGTANAVDLINSTAMPGLPIDSNGKRILLVPTGYKIQVAPKVTITAAKTVTVTAIGEQY